MQRSSKGKRRQGNGKTSKDTGQDLLRGACTRVHWLGRGSRPFAARHEHGVCSVVVRWRRRLPQGDDEPSGLRFGFERDAEGDAGSADEADNANKSDEEKAKAMQQAQMELQQKEQDLISGIQKKIDDAVKQVAEAKGLSVVIDKSAVVYGGQDITDDVMKKFK